MTRQMFIRKAMSIISIVAILAMTVVPDAFAASPKDDGLTGKICEIATALKSAAGILVFLGIVIFALTLISPAQSLFQKVGLNVQNDYLVSVAIGSVLMAGASAIAGFFFVGPMCGG